MNSSAKGKAISPMERGTRRVTPTNSSTTCTTRVTVTVTSSSALASSKLPKLYRPR